MDKEVKAYVDVHAAMDSYDDSEWNDQHMPWLFFIHQNAQGDFSIIESYCWDGDIVEMPDGTSIIVTALSKRTNNGHTMEGFEDLTQAETWVKLKLVKPSCVFRTASKIVTRSESGEITYGDE